MSDVLAAASLLVAVIAVLFGAWNNDIATAVWIVLEDKRANRKAQRKQILDALLPKALPLAVGAWLTFSVFAPRAKHLIQASVRCSAGCRYDDIGTAFVLTEVVAFALAASLSFETARLTALLRASFGPDR